MYKEWWNTKDTKRECESVMSVHGERANWRLTEAEESCEEKREDFIRIVFVNFQMEKNIIVTCLQAII